MTREELFARLNSIEWNDIEFKEAAWAIPRDALSTVSAFANTSGGHLVFGIKEENGTFSVSGVIGADKVQNDFLGQVRDQNKISVFLPINGELHSLDESTVIVFYVPEAQRNEKPVFLDGNPKKSYIRRGGRDDTCTGEELIRFIRDAAPTRPRDPGLVRDLGRSHDTGLRDCAGARLRRRLQPAAGAAARPARRAAGAALGRPHGAAQPPS